jgi:FkbM family methyltransferase
MYDCYVHRVFHMTTDSSIDYTQTYWAYLERLEVVASQSTTEKINHQLAHTNWDEPESGLDWNNLGVLCLIAAEENEDLELRELYLEMAVQSLESGVPNHVLCAAHLAHVYSLLGTREQSLSLAFSHLQSVIRRMYEPHSAESAGLAYLPSTDKYLSVYQGETLQEILDSTNSYTQTILLLKEIFFRSNLVFYNSFGLRSLHLAAHLCPDVASINLRLGLSCLFNNQVEGLLYLQRAWQKNSYDPSILQSLYLISRDIGDLEHALHWCQLAQSYRKQQPSSNTAWQWTDLPTDSSFSLVPFEKNYLLAIEPSLRSIVTTMFLGEGDWFEAEMEFWRTQVQPGMVVIDVGANVGVYSLSAAVRVGAEGRVLAIEPFPACVHCLEQTRQVNQLPWLEICEGAASNHDGEIYLSLHGASELNEVVASATQEFIDAGSVKIVPCFSLDSLCDRYQLNRVDFLKIDAEGHEVEVLQGSVGLLRQFRPVVLYENIGGSQTNNLLASEFLQSQGYQLCRYQPYLQKLLPVTPEEIQSGRYLNLVAIPEESSLN